MKKEKLIELAKRYKTLLPEAEELSEESCKEVGHPDPDEAFSHASWLCDEIIQIAELGDVVTANRWLGFVQALLWIDGKQSLDVIYQDVE